MARERWNGDERGHGVGDGRRLVPAVQELLAALQLPRWVAEQPEAHLLPHLREWCARDNRLALRGARVDDAGACLVDLGWTGRRGDVRGARAAVYCCLGQIAESATYVRQRREPPSPDDDAVAPARALRFEIGTGMLAGDTTFEPHGHVVVITVDDVS